MDVIYKNIQQGRLSGVFFLDLKKAFDTVDYQVVQSILSGLNMSLKVIQWFDSYLSSRYQVTKVNGVDSNFMELACGVP